jgi:ubiquinone/menaquinone biosynthesis C-methylase UbiE
VSFDHFDFAALFYDRVIGRSDLDRFRTLLRLPTPGRLLDAGGGTGRVSSALRPLVRSVVVTDLSLGMLSEARAKGTVAPVRGHAERLPFPDGSFDRVLVVDALHHFCDQRESIADLLRVLAPGGRLVIEEPDYTRVAVKLVAVLEKLALMRSRFHTPESIALMVASHGLHATIERGDRFRSWIIVDR